MSSRWKKYRPPIGTIGSSGRMCRSKVRSETRHSSAASARVISGESITLASRRTSYRTSALHATKRSAAGDSTASSFVLAPVGIRAAAAHLY